MYPTPGTLASPERTLDDTAATTAGADRKVRPGAAADRCFGAGRAVTLEASVPPCWCVIPRVREDLPEMHTLTGPPRGAVGGRLVRNPRAKAVVGKDVASATAETTPRTEAAAVTR